MKLTKRHGKRVAALLLSAAMTVGLAACDGTAAPSASAPGTTPSATPAGGEQTATDLIQETLVEATGTQTGNLAAQGKYYTDFSTIDEARELGEQLNIEVGSEGFVLLKNQDNTLPLSDTDRNITLFGYRSSRLQTVGGGSGAGDGFGHEWSLQESMEEAGLNVNEKLLNYYSSVDNPDALELDPDTYAASIEGTFDFYGDAVLWTISRTGSEGRDLLTAEVPGHSDPTEHYLELDDNEKKVYEYLKELKQEGRIQKFIVIVNSANAFELGDMQDDSDVDAIIWVGHPGNAGIAALGKILTGEVNPSGHLVDIFARDFTQDPTWSNFGSNVQNGLDNYVYYDDNGTLTDSGYRSVEYREGIYMGYRWYETVAADMEAQSEGSGESWYQENVVYPFGYGLSYTTFDWELTGVAETAVIDAPNRTVTMQVKVSNTGDVAGKDVVQVYASQPYTDGGIEKAARVLMGFAKTDLLQPGESQVVQVQFVAQDMASYDYNDKNGNGFKGYELEAGDYIISINRNSHEVVDSVVRTVEGDGILCETDLTSGNAIGNVYSGGETVNGKNVERYKSTNDALEANEISREGGLELPTPSTQEDRTITAEKKAFYDAEETYLAYQDQETDPWYVAATPETWTQSNAETETVTLTIEGNATNPTPRTTTQIQRADGSRAEILLSDMSGISYTEPQVDENGNVILGTDEGSQKWDEFMNQLTWSEMASIVTQGYYLSPALPAIDKVEGVDGDGPSQVKAGFYNRTTPGGTLWACGCVVAATFNTELAAAIGNMCGNEALFLNLGGWYGPGLEIHRSPFGGRNFEYYSEDGVLAGKISAALIGGVQAKGVRTYMKHMFLNNQETNRSTLGGVFTWCNEQAIREIYVKPYEYAVKYGHSTGSMSGMNRVGDAMCYTNYATMTALMRDEWGYQGANVTDTLFNSEYHTFDAMVRAGQDIPLGVRPGGYAEPLSGTWDPTANDGRGGVLIKADAEAETDTVLSPTQYYAVRMCAQHILYSAANNLDIHNQMHAFEFTDLAVEFSAESGEADVSHSDATAEAIAVTYSTESPLPEGLTLTPDGMLTGEVAAGTPAFTIQVDVRADYYLYFTYNVTVTVV